MAGEITVNASLRINSVEAGLPLLTHQKTATVDQTNKQKVSLTLDCTTTTASIDLSGLTAKGYTFFENIGTASNAIVMVGTNEAFVVPPGVGYFTNLSDSSSYVTKTSSGTTTLVVEAYGG
jgi:hypothetical protein